MVRKVKCYSLVYRYIEWNDSGLCIPRKIASSMALLAIDVSEISVVQSSLVDLQNALASFIYEFNSSWTYSQILDATNKKANCQHFIGMFVIRVFLQNL